MNSNFQADLVILNGDVITLNPERPHAQAIATKFGRILAVGSNKEVQNLAGNSTVVIELNQQTVIPGLIDAHCHPLWSARFKSQIDCTFQGINSIQDVKRLIASKVKHTPSGRWICGYGFDDTKVIEQRMLTRRDLDEVSPDHPVWIRHVSVHLATVNSLSLKLANLNRNSLNPKGGSFGRESENGDLNGIVYETAQDKFLSGAKPIIPPPTIEEDWRASINVSKTAGSLGITSFTDALVDPPMIRAYDNAAKSGDLNVRVNMLVSEIHLEQLIENGFEGSFGNDRLKIGGVKFVVDGAIAGRTAYVSEPYLGTTDDFGILAISPSRLKSRVLKAHAAGFQIAVHANGDKAVELTLDAFEKALALHPKKDHRHRIEHCTIINPALLKRIKQLGIMVVPFGSYIYYHGEKMKYYGAKRLSHMFAHRSFLNADIPVAGSSDHPCAPWNPLAGIQSCVTRRSIGGEVLGQEQRLDVLEALKVYTLGGAYASFEERYKGSLEVGKLADMVVLNGNPLKVSPDTIQDIQVDMTIVGGEIIYKAK